MQRYCQIRLWFVLYLVVLSLGAAIVSGENATAAPLAVDPIAQQVTVTPAKVLYGEWVEISVQGFLREYTLPAGAVTLAGVRLPVPGYFGTPGERPKSDKDGNLTFRTYPPLDTPLGSQPLVVAVDPIFLAITTLEFPGAPLTISAKSAVANQRVQPESGVSRRVYHGSQQ